MWRYRELLPIDGEPTVGTQVGFTPLVRADRLARRLGMRELYIKNDTVNYPTLSFKDRVVSVALSRARELGLETVACASTGNLANSVAANAAAAGLTSYVLIPADLESGKVLGSLVYGTRVIGIHGAYDQVNRLCSEIAGKYGWGFVNVNLRPYYAEGSKTMGFEIAEQLGWRAPRHTVVPMASGSLLTKIHKAYKEFTQLGLIEHTHFSVHGAQATGCSPITEGMKKGSDLVKPVAKPQTIAKSLAIGTPADGYYAIHTMRDTGGFGGGCQRRGDHRRHQDARRVRGHLRGNGRRRDRGLRQETRRNRQDRPEREHGALHHRPRPQNGRGGRRALWRAAPHQAEPARVRGPHPRGTRRCEAAVSKLIPFFIHHAHQHPHPHPAPQTDLRTRGRAGRGFTIDEILQSLDTTYPGLKERICDEQGNVRRFVNVYLNDEDIPFPRRKGHRRQRRAMKSASSRRLQGDRKFYLRRRWLGNPLCRARAMQAAESCPGCPRLTSRIRAGNLPPSGAQAA